MQTTKTKHALARSRSLRPPARVLPCLTRLLSPVDKFTSILGEVFDVSKGAKHYGKGGPYEGFTGKDASRSFVSGDFSEVL